NRVEISEKFLAKAPVSQREIVPADSQHVDVAVHDVHGIRLQLSICGSDEAFLENVVVEQEGNALTAGQHDAFIRPDGGEAAVLIMPEIAHSIIERSVATHRIFSTVRRPVVDHDQFDVLERLRQCLLNARRQEPFEIALVSRRDDRDFWYTLQIARADFPALTYELGDSHASLPTRHISWRAGRGLHQLPPPGDGDAFINR